MTGPKPIHTPGCTWRGPGPVKDESLLWAELGDSAKRGSPEQKVAAGREGKDYAVPLWVTKSRGDPEGSLHPFLMGEGSRDEEDSRSGPEKSQPTGRWPGGRRERRIQSRGKTESHVYV